MRKDEKTLHGLRRQSGESGERPVARLQVMSAQRHLVQSRKLAGFLLSGFVMVIKIAHPRKQPCVSPSWIRLKPVEGQQNSGN
jgi:hypothetical protein